MLMIVETVEDGMGNRPLRVWAWSSSRCGWGRLRLKLDS